MSRHVATDNDTDFSLSLEDVALLYQRAGHPRTLRSLQRYCASGHLDARKIATMLGDKYLVTPQSVTRHIAQIVEFSQLDLVATGRDMSRPVATGTSNAPTSNDRATYDDRPRQPGTYDNHAARQGATYGDIARQGATGGDGIFNGLHNDSEPSFVDAAEHHARTAPTDSRDIARQDDATYDDKQRQAATYVAQKFSSDRPLSHNAHYEPASQSQQATSAYDISEQDGATGSDRQRQTPPPAHDIARQESAPERDTARHCATDDAEPKSNSRYVALLEQQLEIAKDERDFLREQINRKDKTIKSLIERDRETNILVRGLQEMLTPLLGGRRQDNAQSYIHH